jgi:hypothetical protein
VSDQGPTTSDPEPARPARPVKKVAKKRPAGSKPKSSGSSSKARSSGRPDGGSAPPPINDAQATTRGAIVIAVTVVVGLLIFWQGFSHEASETVATGGSPTTVFSPDLDAAPTTTEATQGTTVPSTPITKVPPDEIAVIVANSVDASQIIAGPKAQQLVDAGYPQPVTMDLPPYGAATSVVYYTGDLESEAQAIAIVLGLPDSAVTPMPTNAPTSMENAQILVVIGQDGV